ncbi:MAG TPA: endospore germination permease [Bacillota bacterium]|nr:endospore germination permease [Bacillota bacterium]HPT67383.1 endospore germination permease [Bacillota bacterium]
MSRRVLSAKQVGRLVVGHTVGAAILTLPNVAVRAFGSSAWWVLFVLGLFFTVGAWFTAVLVRRFPEETLVEFAPKLLGRPLGFILNLLLILMLLSIVPIEVRAMLEITNISILPLGPAWFISGIFLLAVAYGVSKGLDTFAQVNEILIGLALIIGATVVVLGWQNFDSIHLYPLFHPKDFRWQPMLLIGPSMAFFGYPIIYYLAPFLKDPDRLVGSATRSMFFITLLFSFFTLTIQGVFGDKETLNQSWPALELAKSIHLPGIFIERMDLVLILAWIPAIYTTASASMFFGILALVRLFKLRSTSLVIWGLAAIFYWLSGLLTNYFEWTKWSGYLGFLGLFISILLPLVLWLAYLMRPGADQAEPKGEGGTAR